MCKLLQTAHDPCEGLYIGDYCRYIYHSGRSYSDYFLDFTSSIAYDLKHHSGCYDGESGLTPSLSTPQHLQLQRRVCVSEFCHSVRHYDGLFYFAFQHQILRIEFDPPRRAVVLITGNHILGLNIYKDRIYALERDSHVHVCVYDLAGKFVFSWIHADCPSGYFTNLPIVSDQVVLANREESKLMVYSLRGQVMKSIDLLHLSAHRVSMCLGGHSSVVIADYTASLIYRVSITSGGVLWTCTDVTHPLGIAYDGQNHLFVSCERSHVIKVLNAETGKYMRRLGVVLSRTKYLVWIFQLFSCLLFFWWGALHTPLIALRSLLGHT